MPLYRISIIGLGYVGMPLARLFADNGHEVYGVDVDERKISLLQNGVSYLSDFTNSDISRLTDTNRFHAGSSYDAVSQADVIVICVPTPLDEHDSPDLSYLQSAVRGIVPYLRRGQLIVLESSTYPGTCEEVLKPLLESTGMKVGRDLFLAYSPERINPGTPWRLEEIPKILGGFTRECTDYAKQVYGSVFHEVIVVSSLRTAEMTKLLENSQRFVNISLMNSLLPLARELDISLWEVIDAAGTKPFGFTPYYPGAGIGGHCIPVDPLYLLWKAKEHHHNLPFIELSHQVNQQMPAYTVERLAEILRPVELGDSSILVIGVTYKKDVNDIRESAALKVISILQQNGSKVSFFDPYVQELTIGGASVPYIALTESNVKSFDCVLILADHSNVPYDLVAAHASLILDTKNVIAKYAVRENIISL
ncbi:nucleotide sugar dehydrogenase [Cohnella pontilimi]|uniref:nucleotide sugar dehydrogenase n=1 Tax=Cohnella pontilimi TaxID=2564100 RepID=UPI00319E54BD